jgi:hypothetical protein
VYNFAMSLIAETRPRYFVVEKGKTTPRDWSPGSWDRSWPHDCRYYGQVFLEMEKRLKVPNLRIYMTWDVDRLPEYGDNIVVALLGDECGLIPRYGRHVRAVVKTMGTFPFLGIRRWRPFDRLRFLMFIKYLRNLGLHARSRVAAARPPGGWPAPVRKKPLIIHSPLGYALLEDVPMTTMHERPYHCFFAGLVATAPDRHGYRKWLSRPKDQIRKLGRQAMLRAVEEFQKKEPRFRFDGSVVGSASMTGERADGRVYSQRMMHSKICLAPRGSVVDTWRFFEGVRSGCLVITEPLPNEYYYKEAPVIQIDRWEELERVIRPFLDDDDALEVCRQRTLAYWRDLCGEAAFGAYLARCIHSGRPCPE